MPDFPAFIKNASNRIARSSQYTDGIKGYVFDGAGGSHVALWSAHTERTSSAAGTRTLHVFGARRTEREAA
jgi:hypothetical protein